MTQYEEDMIDQAHHAMVDVRKKSIAFLKSLREDVEKLIEPCDLDGTMLSVDEVVRGIATSLHDAMIDGLIDARDVERRVYTETALGLGSWPEWEKEVVG